jgi:uncharacterized protein YjbI with pentapeptide repeats
VNRRGHACGGSPNEEVLRGRCDGVAVTTEERDPLQPVERELIDYVERGELLDLANKQPVDVAALGSCGPSQIVRAWVLRDILRGRLAPDPDPHGIRLRGARITGRLDLDDLTSTVPLALGDCLLEEGLTAADADLAGLILTGCHLDHPDQPALHAERLTTTLLDLNQATLTGNTTTGAVTLLGAHLSLLTCTGASLHNKTGPALLADGLRVDQNVFLNAEFKAVGAGKRGAVRLTGPHLGLLDCKGASLHNKTGPALFADVVRVDLAVFLRVGFEAVGAGEYGAVRLLGAHLGELDCTGASLRNETGPALIASRLRVDRAVSLSNVSATGAGRGAVIVLTDARIAGAFMFNPARLEHRTNPRARITVDGLVYSGLPNGMSTEKWLRLLAEGTPDYAAQPYQHLAAAHRVAGHDSQARHVLMTQRHDQIRRHALTGRGERVWARFTGLTLGYGYQPWRALLGLLAVLVTAVVLAVVLGAHGGLAQIRNPPPPTPQACTVIERIGVGLDLGTALITTGTRPRCEPTSTSTGQALTLTSWALRLLAWAFATLFIAGFTGAVRKT